MSNSTKPFKPGDRVRFDNTDSKGTVCDPAYEGANVLVDWGAHGVQAKAPGLLTHVKDHHGEQLVRLRRRAEKQSLQLSQQELALIERNEKITALKAEIDHPRSKTSLRKHIKAVDKAYHDERKQHAKALVRIAELEDQLAEIALFVVDSLFPGVVAKAPSCYVDGACSRDSDGDGDCNICVNHVFTWQIPAVL